MNKSKVKLFPIILLCVIVLSSLVLYFSSSDAQHPEMIVGSMQQILHVSSKWILCVASILALVYLMVSYEHNRNEINRVKNTYKPWKDE